MKKAVTYVIIISLIVAFGVLIVYKKSLAPRSFYLMKISSPAFNHSEPIPAKFTCQGENINPELNISGVPADAKSLALIMDDPDIPDYVKTERGIKVFDHWVAFNIPPETEKINEGTEPSGTIGSNGAGRTGYTGPCPPDREHRYFFKLYALDGMIDLPAGSSRQDVEKAIAGHIIEQTELIGTYVKE